MSTGTPTPPHDGPGAPEAGATAAGAPTAPVAPTAADPVARAASEVLGGPAGRHLGAGGPWWAQPLPVLVALTSVLVALGALTKHHCRAQGWNTPDQFVHACYSDLPVVYTSSGLVEGLGPYAGTAPLGQPPVTAALAWLVARAAPHEVTAAAQRAYFDAGAVVLLLAALATAVAVAVTAGPRRRWDAALFALSPLLVLSALVSFDLAGVALATAGLALWARRRPVGAGVLLGLAVAARTYPVLLLVALALLALRAGRPRAAATTVLTALAAWAAVNAPFALTSPGTWSAHLRDALSRPAGYGSPWLLPQLLEQAAGDAGATGLGAGAVTALTVGGWAVWLLLVALLVLWAPRRPRLPQVAFLLVAGACALGPAFPPQASLWLAPLAALAVPRWREHLLWWAAEAAYFAAVWLYVAGQSQPSRALPPELYALLLVLRLAALAWLAGSVVRDVRSPWRDPVRAEGLDDPAGGDVDRAPDALVVRVA
ncbi:glycosyltransferase 87 family protein [Kineococcus sp. SYSU DK005]|uniref:glycosyltransferase 87 family protein n=1 Tax=Kineococcus sp. SYSU DK005 TaxID=3383126 RepID=UPI003D7E6F7F